MHADTTLADSASQVHTPHSKPAVHPSQIPWQQLTKPLALTTLGFLLFFFLPMENPRFTGAILESLALARWYAREHVLLCLIPAFFIAGAIAVFVSQGAVMKYLGGNASKVLSYGVAGVSGTILAVCSCTVLPLFAGIWKRGAGLGPAVAFLYSGPAVNVLAVILTARILGPQIGLARAVGAILFSVVIGLLMHLMFRREEATRMAGTVHMPEPENNRPLWQTALLFGGMVGLLISATWSRPEQATGIWLAVFEFKWILTSLFALLLGLMMVRWMGIPIHKLVAAGIMVLIAVLTFPQYPLIAFATGLIAFVVMLTTTHGETESWFMAAWDLARQIMPLLLVGVLVAGLLLGQPHTAGLIPSQWIADLVGGNSLWANLFAAVLGAFMYFATLTEVPILQGLIGAGMGKGPALALLLAGPALSLPNMLVIRSVIGTRKTITFVSLVVVMATVSGLIFGHFC